jgi:putative FmdB family regulatory protein
MILYQYQCSKCNNVFEELREVDMRKWCPCPKCNETAYKTLGAASADVNFRPGVYYDIAPVPVQINSREDFTRVANLMGNYSNMPFSKREAQEIKAPSKREKRILMQKLRRGDYAR